MSPPAVDNRLSLLRQHQIAFCATPALAIHTTRFRIFVYRPHQTLGTKNYSLDCSLSATNFCGAIRLYCPVKASAFQQISGLVTTARNVSHSAWVQPLYSITRRNECSHRELDCCVAVSRFRAPLRCLRSLCRSFAAIPFRVKHCQDSI